MKSKQDLKQSDNKKLIHSGDGDFEKKSINPIDWMHQLKSKGNKWIEKYTFLRFVKGVMTRLKDDEVNDLSAQITYYLLLALFPFMIFLLNLLKYFNIDQMTILNAIQKLVPTQSSVLVFNTVNEVMQNSGVTLLSIGMITTLWSASKGANALIKGLNKAYDVEEERSFIVVKLIGIVATLGIPFMILVSFLFLVLGESIGVFLSSKLGLTDYLGLWELLRVILPLGAMVIYFTLFYKLAPNRHILTKQAIVGALFSTLGWVTISVGFSYYVKNFGNYSKVYGGLGSIIILLLWLYISSAILMIGGEINAEFAKPCNKRKEEV